MASEIRFPSQPSISPTAEGFAPQMANARQAAIQAIASAKHCLNRIDFRQTPVKDLFGVNVFSIEEQRQRLPKPVFQALRRTIDRGVPLEADHADAIAVAMKDWAMEKGATHYTHLFQPLTGLTAEKHDSFISPMSDGRAIAHFGGNELIKGEPDASSFPSGGIRATFEARGYTAWDPTSPVFIVESPNGATLVIPTAFLSYTGEALDKKTPLLRSMAVIDRQAKRVLKLFGKTPARVYPTVGPEQEYFLIDKTFYLARPDLVHCGRTLFGARPPKGQEMEDQYFGSIPERVIAYMAEVEVELFKLGVPVKTRHNEVAPGQYEIAPLFENTNIATDHQMLVMQTLRRVADKYGLACILHEKPFARMNGSGKHNNWSLATTDGDNLLEPGDNPHDNAQFLVFCVAVISAVYRYGDVLRAAIASAHNDHRLGANEAPPAIISVFLGEQLEDVMNQIEQGGARSSKSGGVFETGVDVLPKLPKEAGDRNRTSPFAFTGNKFEFRAVGSSQNIARPNTIINAMVAERLDHVATELERALEGGQELNTAIQSLLARMIKEARGVIFNGDNYSREWHVEAEKRGLQNLPTTPDALSVLQGEKALGLLTKHGIYTPAELRSRYRILVEQYVKTLAIEGETATHMARTMILPAAMRYAQELSQAVTAMTAAGVAEPAGREALRRVNDLIVKLETQVARLDKALDHEHPEDPEAATRFMRDEVLAAMNDVRETADLLEEIVADDLWPLPTYREMLFVR